MAFRTYVEDDCGRWRRVSQREADAKVVPEFANSRRRCIDVGFKMRDPLQFTSVLGSHLEFDADGAYWPYQEKQQRLAMTFVFSSMSPNEQVVELSSARSEKNAREQYFAERWQPSAEDFNEIAADIWKQAKPKDPGPSLRLI